jgi:F420-non-reducing hydrogenase large subunit
VAALPGGWSKRINEDERRQIEEWSKDLVELGKLTLQVFEDVVLKNPKYMDLVTGDIYRVEVGYQGGVDDQDRVTYYDATQKVIDAKGNLVGSFRGKEYLDFISERVLPWSYMKFPYQKKLGGWKGIQEGPDTNIYAVGPLARMNVAKGMDTPLAQEHFEKFHQAFGSKPVHQILGYHWARAIELLNAAEKCLQLSRDPEITSEDTWTQPTSCTGEGVGIIEAPRGTLIHHYKTDQNGIVTDANLIVATTHNNAPINLAVKRAAKAFIKNGEVSEAMLNHVEMAFRPYDLCLACATHAVTGGQTPLEVDIYSADGQLYRKIKNF